MLSRTTSWALRNSRSCTYPNASNFVVQYAWTTHQLSRHCRSFREITDRLRDARFRARSQMRSRIIWLLDRADSTRSLCRPHRPYAHKTRTFPSWLLLRARPHTFPGPQHHLRNLRIAIPRARLDMRHMRCTFPVPSSTFAPRPHASPHASIDLRNLRLAFPRRRNLFCPLRLIFSRRRNMFCRLRLVFRLPRNAILKTRHALLVTIFSHARSVQTCREHALLFYFG
jgi:hypothetical protein